MLFYYLFFKMSSHNIWIVSISLVAITIITISVSGCECVAKPNCNGDFNFILRDKITKSDLLQGANARYSVDTINHNFIIDSTRGSSNYIQPRNDLGIIIWEVFQSSDTLYLKLNSTDTDTLLLSFRNMNGNTCRPTGIRAINGVIYNGEQAKQENGNYILEK